MIDGETNVLFPKYVMIQNLISDVKIPYYIRIETILVYHLFEPILDIMHYISIIN